MSEINVVPYIDVMLVLLIIFMVTAPLLQLGVEVELPNAPAETLSGETDQKELVVVVDRHGQFYVNQERRPISDDEFTDTVAALLSKDPDLPVYVRGDQGVNYGRVVTAMVILQHAGAQGVGLITEPPPKNRN